MRSSNKNAEFTRNTAQSTITMLRRFEIIDDYDPATSLFIKTPSVKTPLPLKSQCITDYTFTSGNISESFHDLYKLKKAHLNPEKKSATYFFKQNKYEKTDQYMYELEATICAFYRFLAPEYAPISHAIYDEKKRYVGIAVKELPGFKKVLDEPLTKDDLEVKALKYCTIEDLEEIDERALSENLDLSKIPDTEIIHLTKRMVKITAKDLINFRILRGLAIGLVISYAFEEDDNHRGNMAKDGKRIDFDMSFWKLLFNFKKTGPVDWAFRDPKGRFNVTARDIKKFPNIEDALLFYWCTIPSRVLPEAFILIASKFFQVSRNAFQSHENVIYQTLEKNLVFKHYEYATFLKLALTRQEHYKNISSMHIRSDSFYKNKSIIDMVSLHVGERLQMIRQELIKVSEFNDFIVNHGDNVIKDIVLDFAVYNAKLENKIKTQPLYQNQFVNLTDVINDYAHFCAEMSIPKSQDRIKQDEDIASLLIHDNSNCDNVASQYVYNK
jgi:hypothetical protein